LFSKVNLVATIKPFHYCLALVSDVTHFIRVTLTVKKKKKKTTFTKKEEYLNSGNACFHSVEKLLSFCLLSEKKKMECTKL
jgi:hypothetical protein